MENFILGLFLLWAFGAMCYFVKDVFNGCPNREVIIGPHQLELNLVIVGD